MSELKVVMIGAGAAGAAVARLLMDSGVRDIILFDSKGPIYPDRPGLDEDRAALAEITNPRGHTGTIPEAMEGADVFIGLSQPNLIAGADVERMAEGAIVFALANPDPEIDPVIAAKYAAVVATGRSDYPNQINNVLAFPGLFRGLLDAGAHKITNAALIAAANAIAEVVSDDALSPIYIVPSVFDEAVAPAVADAVTRAAESS
jgi:Malic enzyme